MLGGGSGWQVWDVWVRACAYVWYAMAVQCSVQLCVGWSSCAWVGPVVRGLVWEYHYNAITMRGRCGPMWTKCVKVDLVCQGGPSVSTRQDDHRLVRTVVEKNIFPSI